MMIKNTTINVAVILLLTGWAQAGTVTVGPGGSYDHETIQAGIDAAGAGDTVVVADGTYTGVGNRDINFGGKAITVVSENGPSGCVIDCLGSESYPHRGFYFRNNEGSGSVVDGFTIINGYTGMMLPDDNGKGGGIYCYSADPTIKNCIIKNNFAVTDGGGIACSDSTSRIVNCLIVDNSANGAGGGLYCTVQSSIEVINCTISGNQSVNKGGGFCCRSGSNSTLTNSILWNNAARMVWR